MAGVRVTLMYDVKLEPGVNAARASLLALEIMERLGREVDGVAWPSPFNHLATTKLVGHAQAGPMPESVQP